MLSWCKSPAAYLQCTQARTVRSEFICLQHMFSSLRATHVSQLMARIRDERCIYGRWWWWGGGGEAVALCFTLAGAQLTSLLAMKISRCSASRRLD